MCLWLWRRTPRDLRRSSETPGIPRECKRIKVDSISSPSSLPPVEEWVLWQWGSVFPEKYCILQGILMVSWGGRNPTRYLKTTKTGLGKFNWENTSASCLEQTNKPVGERVWLECVWKNFAQMNTFSKLLMTYDKWFSIICLATIKAYFILEKGVKVEDSVCCSYLDMENGPYWDKTGL